MSFNCSHFWLFLYFGSWTVFAIKFSAGLMRWDLTLFSRRPDEAGCDRCSGGGDGAGLLVPVAWGPQLGVLDQESEQRSPGGFQCTVRSVLLPPLQGEGRLPEEDDHGREHLPEERHSPGYRPVPVLHSDLPSRLLVDHRAGGGFR